MELPEKRDEVSPMAGPSKARRAATLHSGVFHFNGPPGDWLTPTRDPSPFRHNGPLHYLFVLANVLLAVPFPAATRTKLLVFHVSYHPHMLLIACRENKDIKNWKRRDRIGKLYICTLDGKLNVQTHEFI